MTFTEGMTPQPEQALEAALAEFETENRGMLRDMEGWDSGRFPEMGEIGVLPAWEQVKVHIQQQRDELARLREALERAKNAQMEIAQRLKNRAEHSSGKMRIGYLAAAEWILDAPDVTQALAQAPESQRQESSLTPTQRELLLCWVGVHEATILPMEEMKDFLERGYVAQEIEQGDIIYKPTVEGLKAARALARELNVGNGRVLNAEAQP